MFRDTTTTAPTLALSTDTGSSASDNITSNVSAVSVSGTESGVTVTYKVDGATSFGSYVAPTTDGAHTVVALSTDTAGNTATGAALVFTRDTTTTAPTLALSTDTGSSASDNITSNVSAVSVSGTESGVTVTYKVDGASSFGSYVAPTTDGAHTVVALSTDTAGNTATSAALVFTRDTTTTAPTLALSTDTGSSSTDRITNNVNLSVSGTESGATVTYKVDGATAFGSYVAPTTDGAHTVVALSTDTAGNTATGSLVFTRDTTTTAPTLALSTDTGSSSTDRITNNVNLSVSGTESGATVTYKVDGATAFGSYVAPTTDGAHTVVALSTDTAGNTATSAALVFTRDTTTTAPTLALSTDTGSSATDNITSNVSGVSVSGTESGVTVTYKVDGATAFGSYVAPTTDGAHTVVALSTDTAGNTATSAALVFTRDTTAPTLDLDQNSTGSGYTLNATSTNTDYFIQNTASSGIYRALLTETNTIASLSITVNTSVSASSLASEYIKVGGTTINLDGSSLPSTVSVNSLSWSVSYSSGVFTFTPTGSATSGLAQALIRATTYGATTLPTGGNRTLSVGLVDIAGNSASAAVATVSADNTGPVIDLDTSTSGNDFSSLNVSLASANAGVSLGSTPAMTESSDVASVKVAVTGLINGTSEQLVVGSTAYNADGSSVSGSVTVSGTTWNVSYANGAFTFAYASGTAASAAQAQALIAGMKYKNTASSGIDGVRTFTFSATDTANNVTATAAVATISVNAATPALLSTGTATAGTTVVNGVTYVSNSNGVLTTLDVDGNGTLGDQFIVTFSEAIQVSNVTNTANWTLSSGTLGTGATITALNAVTVGGVQYATKFLFASGTGATYTTGTTLTLAAANVVDTGGATATAAQVVTMTDIVSPTAPTAPTSISGDNIVNASEKTAGVTFAFTHPAVDSSNSSSTGGNKLKVYYDGVFLKDVTLTSTSRTVTLTGSEWGSDGTHTITTKVADAMGNLSDASPAKTVIVDTGLAAGFQSFNVVTDSGTVGTPDQNDVVQVVFNEAVSISNSSLPTSIFGTGASVTAVGGQGGKSTTWQITLGATPAASMADLSSVVFSSVSDVAGNSGSVTGSTTGNPFSSPGVPTIDNVTSDNVINSTEMASAQTVKVSFGANRLQSGDVVKLYMDGQLVQTVTANATDAGNGFVNASVAANSWGADGTRELTATAQRGSGAIISTASQRSVYVASDMAHWSTTNNIVWFDANTLTGAAGTSVSSWAAASGNSTATQTTAANQATLQIDSSGNKVLLFSGSQFMSFTTSGVLPTGTTYNLTMISAQQIQTLTAWNFALMYGASGGGGNGSWALGATNSNDSSIPNTLVLDSTGGGSAAYDGALGTANSVSLNTWVAISGQVTESGSSTGNNAVVYSAGNKVFQTTSTAISQNTSLGSSPTGFLGGTSAGNRFTGLIGDQILTGTLLSNAARMEIETYIAVKYGSGTVTALNNTNAYDLSASALAGSIIDDRLDLSTKVSNDTITTAGTDYVNAGAGNDTLIIKDLNFRFLDGGLGTDTLKLASAYSGANTIVLGDYVSNSRATSGVSADDTRVNTNGFHKLQGIEAIDLSGSTAAQALTVTAADVNQLSEDNKLWVKLGTADGSTGASSVTDTLTPTGLGSSATWGYFTHTETDGTTAVYDRKWTGTSGSQSVELYASGGKFTKTDTGSLFNSAPGSDTLTGTSGADVFAWLANQSGSDVVSNFTKSQGDKLDLRELLAPVGFNLAHLSDYLSLSQSGTDAVLKIDTDGGGNFASNAQTITLTGAWADLNVGTSGTDSLTQLNTQHIVFLA